jgi:hypothetical protein
LSFRRLILNYSFSKPHNYPIFADYNRSKKYFEFENGFC